MEAKLHVLWVPSWYPTSNHPLNGSFFSEHVRMLAEAGLKINVAAIHAGSVLSPGQITWDLRRDRWAEQLTIPTDYQLVSGPNQLSEYPAVYQGTTVTVPKGALPGDRFLIKHQARKFAKCYRKLHGIPDIIHAHSVFPGVLFAQELARIWQRPYGLTEHRPSTLRAAENSPRFKAILQAVRGSAFNMSVSKQIVKLLAKKYGVAFQLCPLPVPDEFYRFPLEHHRASARFKFIHISHVDANKRPELTLRAFAQATQVYSQIEMGIVGGAPERVRELEAEAGRLGIEEKVKFYGAKKRAEIPRLLSAYDCLVLASAIEAGGTVFAEAHALGKPTIATKTYGGVSNVKASNGYLVEIDDQAGLAGAMVQAATNRRHWAEQAAAIRESSYRTSSREAFGRLLTAVYEKAHRGY